MEVLIQIVISNNLIVNLCKRFFYYISIITRILFHKSSLGKIETGIVKKRKYHTSFVIFIKSFKQT